MKTKAKPILRRSHIVAIGLAVVAVAWILSGVLGGGESPAEPPPAAGAETVDDKPLVKVRVARSEATAHVRDIVLRGQTEASRSITLKAETEGRVAAVTAKEGGTVAEGQVIVELAREERDARLAEARALLRQREVEYNAAVKLAEKGYRAETALAEARALLDAARAALAIIQIDIAHTAITVPFDGVLETRYVEVGDFLDVGNDIARVLDLDPVYIVAQVSERHIGALKLGAVAEGRLVSGETVSGPITYISSAADEETRTFRVEVEIPNPTLAIADGVTAEMRLAVDRVLAHQVSPALLTLNDAGEIGVKIVNAEGIVEFHPIAIASDTADGIWLTGLPDRIDIITVGQEFVKAGQKVEPVVGGGVPTS